MPTSIEQNLTLLLPTHAFLPPELVHLSTSLLAQSRSKAASLKPDEEIARTYACCNIACERLRNKLGLDVAKTNPPIKPKIYVKLHAYLTGALNTTKSPQTPSPQKRGWRQLKTATSSRDGSNGSSIGLKSTTPPSGRVAQKRKVHHGIVEPETEQEMPIWVMPLLSQLCGALHAEGAAAHAYAGAQSVLAYERTRGTDDAINECFNKRRRTLLDDHANGDSMSELPCLLLAVYFHVSNRLNGEELGHNYQARKLKGIEVMRTYLNSQKIGTVPAFPADERSAEDDIDMYVQRGKVLWHGMEWYTNIPPAAPLIRTDDERKNELEICAAGDSDVESRQYGMQKQSAKTPLRRKEKHGSRFLDEDDDVAAAGLFPALGTMFHPAIDWLNHDRYNEFNGWKREIFRECAALETKR
nr:hypothetical protein CFP56_33669 [Quercus suber]